MKTRAIIVTAINLAGISILLAVPIFNLWYLSVLSGKNWFKQCYEWHGGSVKK